jgi:hypothetical protein
LFVGYFASAGSMIGLVFHPRLDSLPFNKQLRAATFSLYTPAILISKSRYCPRAIRHHLSWSIGEQRKRVFSHAMTFAKRGFQVNRTQQTSHPRISTPNLGRVAPSWSFWDWRRHQLLSFGASLLDDDKEITFSKMDPAARRRAMQRHSGPSLEEARGLTPPRSEDQVGGCSSEAGATVPPERAFYDVIDVKVPRFEDRPDLVVAELDGGPFVTGFVDIRDERELSKTQHATQDRASVFTFRVACPELLLDESHIVQLQCSAPSSDEDKKSRVFAALADRIVCQKEFPKRDDQSKLMSFSFGFNR